MKIEIPGKPIPLNRPRASKNRFYDSQYQVKENIVLYVNAHYGTLLPLEHPISIYMTFYMPIPISWSKKKKKLFIGQPHTATPDLDNLVKFVNDCFNGVFWQDDSLIAEINAQKVWAYEGLTIFQFKEIQND